MTNGKRSAGIILKQKCHYNSMALSKNTNGSMYESKDKGTKIKNTYDSNDNNTNVLSQPICYDDVWIMSIAVFSKRRLAIRLI